MRYAVRFGIIFAFVLLSGRVSTGIFIGSHWDFFFWAIVVALLNAAIRTFFRALSARCSWMQIIVGAVLLNWLLYSLIFWGAFTWLEISALSYGSIILGAIVVIIPSSICNHFIGFRQTKL